MVTNGDIYFDEEVSNVERMHGLKAGELWCITRYEPRNGMRLEAGIGYDVFSFLVPLPDFDADIAVGTWGCDLYLAQKAVEAGIRVLNPSLTIVSGHKDSVEARRRFTFGFLMHGLADLLRRPDSAGRRLRRLPGRLPGLRRWFGRSSDGTGFKRHALLPNGGTYFYRPDYNPKVAVVPPTALPPDRNAASPPSCPRR